MVSEPAVSPGAAATLTQQESELENVALLAIDRNRTNFNLLPLRRKKWQFMINFEWDDARPASNFKKHRVTFDEAVTVFGLSLAITFPDTDHEDGEYRSRTCGMSSSGRLLVVVHTERRDNVRIISAGKATKYEKNICRKD